MFTITRPFAWIDVESTGLDPQKDRIITLGVELHAPNAPVIVREFQFNPGIPIPPEVSEIHGITDAMVKDWPPFASRGKVIFEKLAPCDFGGFNTTYDLSMLSEEFNRMGLVLDLDGHSILDVGMIYKKKNPRTLTAAVAHYCHRDHAQAHGALADATATREVFEAMLEFHEPLAEMSLADVARYSMEDDRDGSIALDLANVLRVRKDGVVVYGLKKARGVPVKEDTRLAEWVLRTPFPSQTHRIVRKVLESL